jgi:hypothetical protein
MQQNFLQEKVSPFPKVRIAILIIFFPITIYFVIGSGLYRFKNYTKAYNKMLWEKITENSQVNEQLNNQNQTINAMVILMFPIVILPPLIYQLISVVIISFIFGLKSSINIISNLIFLLGTTIIVILFLPFIVLKFIGLRGWNLIVNLLKFSQFIMKEIWEGVKVIFGF